MKILIYLFICFLIINESLSQSLNLYDFDYSKYPQITAKFTATDMDGKLISNLVPEDFQVMENGINRKIISVDCPPAKPTIPLSSVLVLDVSGSMSSGKRIQMTINAAGKWINNLDFSKSECAVTVFSDKNAILADFSQSQNFLLSKIKSLYASKYGWTDYNKALLDSPACVLELVKHRENKKVIVFMSDGNPNFEPYTDSIIKIAIANNITIHCISFFTSAPNCMMRFAFETGGMLFSNIVKQDKLEAAFKKILDIEQDSQDCSITWETFPDCGDISTLVKLFKNNSVFSINNQTPPNQLPNIKTDYQYINFKNILIKNPTSENNKLTAINGDIEILSITSDNTDFSCSPSKFNLTQNESKNLVISYTAQDSGYSVAKFTVKTNLCEYEFYAKAGNPLYFPHQQRLKLIHPNGYERFVVGYDTVITWEGVSPNDTISLEYSIDAGDTWQKISDSATGLIYQWKDIPNSQSDKCLMKAKFKEYELDNYSLNGTTQVPFGFYKSFPSNSNLTIEAWIYYTGGNFSIIKNNFEIIRKGFNQQELWINGNFNEFILPDYAVLDSNKWYHIALVLDRSQPLPVEVFYLNGIKVAEANNNIYPYNLDGYENITVGSGIMDEFRMWSTRRLSSDIHDNYNKSLNLPKVGLMMYYDFDQSVSKAIDISGFQHDGIGNITKIKFSSFKKTQPNQSDVSDNFWSIVKSILQSKDIDMGFCEFGKSKDSVVSAFLTNKGSYPIKITKIDFSGANPEDFALVSDFNSIELKEAENAEVEFRFYPKVTGNRNAIINIYTNDKIYSQNISGHSDKPYIELTSDFINFGLVKVGSLKDTIIIASIKNNSSITINIIKSYQSFPNDKDFYTITGGGSFSLAPGESRQMTLRFLPTFVGKTSGSIVFEFDAPGGPVTMQLFGEGIFNYPAISVDNLNYTTLFCENEITDSIYVRNIGVEDLIINDYNIDNSEFTVVNQLNNINIKPKTNYIVYIKYQPKNSGISNGSLRIFSNAFPDSVFDVQLTGSKESVDYQVSNTNINLGYLCKSEKKNFSIELNNSGSSANKYSLNIPTVISSDFLSGIINSNNIQTINFSYSADNIEMPFSEVIEVTDSICHKKTNINITGIIQNPKMSSDDVTLVSVFGNSTIGSLVLENNSDRDITINNYPNISGDELKFDNLSLPLTIKARDSKIISVIYTPKDEINDNFKIIYNFEPCSQIFTGTVLGQTTITTAKISIGDYEAVAGETVDLIINVTDAVNFENSGIAKIVANISFNSTLLIPLSGDKGSVSKSIRNLDVEIPIINNVPQSVNLKCITGLGNDSITSIKINDVTFDGGYAQINKRNGSFKVDSICYYGGARLINPNSKTQIISIDPTPTENILGIKFELREDENTIVELISTSGKSIKLINQNMNQGIYKFEYDVTELSSGIYYLILRTKNDICTKKVILCK
jgi:VWFA-related protein